MKATPEQVERVRERVGRMLERQREIGNLAEIMDNGQHKEDTMDAETVEAIADAHEALMRAWSLLDGEEGGDPDDAVADAMEAVDTAAVAIAPHCGRT